MKKLKHYIVLLGALLLSGCNLAILDPKGIIAASEKNLLLDSLFLMLIIVVPVVILTFVIVWRYRANNTKAKYTPNWSESTSLEIVWWSVPCVIIAILATMTWVSSHKLDPYRPLDVKGKPLVIEAIALDWKWLFIYPKQHIATLNYVQIPDHVPVRFLITADAPMNSFEIPQLAGQIYAMTGMRTKLNLMATVPGDYVGLSTNFSGDGFSGMHFTVRVSSKSAFDQWAQSVQHSPKHLTLSVYNQLTRPSERNPVTYYSDPEHQLFHHIVMKYMKPDSRLARHTEGKDHA